MCLVADTAKRLFITQRVLFDIVASEKKLSNATIRERFDNFLKKGEVPKYVQDWCLDQWDIHKEGRCVYHNQS